MKLDMEKYSARDKSALKPILTALFPYSDKQGLIVRLLCELPATLALFVFISTSLLSSQTSGQTSAEGKRLFEAHCSMCHTIGGGILAGPDLKGVTARRDAEWLMDFITSPDAMFKKKDPIALQLLAEFENLPMPDSGLTANEISSILLFLEESAGDTAPSGEPAKTSQEPPGAGVEERVSPDADETASPEEGKRVFELRCATCHTIGGGVAVGPDLKGVARIREREWLRSFIANPDKMFANRDPIALELLGEFKNIKMPNLGLSDAEVSALIAYLEAESGMRKKEPVVGVPPQVSDLLTPEATAIEGDAGIGADLFTGSKRFEKGAPACISCHSAGSLGVLGGGTLGPDLTKAYSKYGRDGIVSIMSSLPFPTMRPIFVNKMLTPEEQAHLREFFEKVDGEEPSKMTSGVGLAGFAGLIVLMVIFQVVWQKRNPGTRRGLLKSKRI